MKLFKAKIYPIDGPVYSTVKSIGPASTESICGPAATASSSEPDKLIGTDVWFHQVYRSLRRLQDQGLITSERLWSGKGYSRIWRIK